MIGSQQSGLKQQDIDAECEHWSVETQRNKLEIPGHMGNSCGRLAKKKKKHSGGTAGRIRSFMIIPSAFTLVEQQNNFHRANQTKMRSKTFVDGNRCETPLPVSITLSDVRPATCKTVWVAIALCHNQNEEAHFSQTSCTLS